MSAKKRTVRKAKRKPKIPVTKQPPSEFPKFLMKIDGQRRFLAFRDAYVVYDSGMHQVEFGRYVLDADFTVRKMTVEDKARISNAADDYSASK